MFEKISKSWNNICSKLNTKILCITIWLASLAPIFFIDFCWTCLAIALWASALLLAPHKSYGLSLCLAALLALFFWLVTNQLINFGNIEQSNSNILILPYWFALGLNLVFIGTPLKISQTFSKFLAPLIGKSKSIKIAISLMALIMLIPYLLKSALAIKKNISLRAPTLPITLKMLLWGKAMLNACQTCDKLAISLLKRWPTS